MLPFYINYMGAEAYGLVGFFTLLQAWFILLDMGLTLTVVRETARFRGGATNSINYLSVIRALEWLFAGIALIGCGIMFIAANYIANDWLKTTNLPAAELRNSIELMAGIIALRWMSGLYRSTISGHELLVWLGGYNSFIATLRFGGAIFVLITIGTTPTIFFTYQLCVAAIELTILFLKAYRTLPKIPKYCKRIWSWFNFSPALKFSFSLAFPTILWTLVTQTDKLVLSRILPLTEYGYFTLAIMLANGIIMISDPISTAILPRMTKLEAERNHTNLIHIYRSSTQIVAIIAGATAITITYRAEPLLWVWTNNEILAKQMSSILILYAIGNAILCISAFPFYLQYAKGNLKLHVIGSTIFTIILIPAIIWAAKQYGAIGAGYIWLITNLIFFIFWVPIIHNKFAPQLNLKWYFNDILIIVLPMILIGYLTNIWMPHSKNRLWQLSEILLFGGIVLSTGFLASSFLRGTLTHILRKKLLSIKSKKQYE